MHLPDEGELFRERVQHQMRVGVIEDLLPHVRQAKLQVVHGGYEVNRMAARRHRGGKLFLPARTPRFLRIPIETLLQSLPRCTAIAQTPHLSTLMRPDGDDDGTLGVKVEE